MIEEILYREKLLGSLGGFTRFHTWKNVLKVGDVTIIWKNVLKVGDVCYY